MGTFVLGHGAGTVRARPAAPRARARGVGARGGGSARPPGARVRGRGVRAPGAGAPAPPPVAGARAPPLESEPSPDPRFAPGALVGARNVHPAGYTRLPRYARGKR